jgi:hypothetical protein
MITIHHNELSIELQMKNINKKNVTTRYENQEQKTLNEMKWKTHQLNRSVGRFQRRHRWNRKSTPAMNHNRRITTSVCVGWKADSLNELHDRKINRASRCQLCNTKSSSISRRNHSDEVSTSSISLAIFSGTLRRLPELHNCWLSN